MTADHETHAPATDARPDEDAPLLAWQMELLGRLGAGVNHDFNNLLCVVLANAAYLLELPHDTPLSDADVRECLEDMRSAAQAGAELTSRLAIFGDGAPVVHEPVDVSALCAELIETLRASWPSSLQVEARLQSGVHVRGVRAHLWHMLLDPALNARDAMPEGGTLVVELERQPAIEAEGVAALHAAGQAVITFRDSGCGMTPEVLKSAFEPFFTTKDFAFGRGLGLASVRRVVAQHGGCVTLSSRVGEGSTLRIALPLAPAAAEDLELAVLSVCGGSGA